MRPGSESAHSITDDLLDRSGEAFVTGDFELFQECIALPYQLETFIGIRTFQTTEELRRLFETVRTYHWKNGVTQMARHVVEALFRDENTVLATFETRLLNGTILTQDPYPTFAVIIRDAVGWRTNNMTFAIEDMPSHNEALMGWSDGTPGTGATKE